MTFKGYRARETNAAMKRAANASEDMQRIRALRSAMYEKRALEAEHAKAQAEVRRIREAMEAEHNRPSHEDQLDNALKVAIAIANQLKGSAEPNDEAGSKKKKEARIDA